MSEKRVLLTRNGEFKQEVIETLHRERMGINETARKYNVSSRCVRLWDRIYLEEGPEGLYVERRGRASIANGVKKGYQPKLDKKVEEDLIAENQRLRAENEYLKKLNALVQQRMQQYLKKSK